jgi:hypothetical protein
MDATDDFADWHEKLSQAEGLLCGRERRVSAAELLSLLDLDDLAGANRIEALTQIKRIMTSIGWRPKVTKIGGKSVRGYVRRDPQAPPPPAEEPAVVVSRPVLTEINNPTPDSLSRHLEKITGMALKQAEEILELPLDDATSGNIMRAKTSIVGTVLTTQARVDENSLRTKRDSGVLDRLEKLIRQARREIPREPKSAATKPLQESAGA